MGRNITWQEDLVESDVIIVGEQFAHPAQRIVDTKQDIQALREYIQLQIDDLDKNVLPHLNVIAKNKTVIFTAAYIFSKYDRSWNETQKHDFRAEQHEWNYRKIVLI